MTRFTISTVGPCPRCGLLARHILIVDGRRYVEHNQITAGRCPIQPGEMVETGQPVEVP